MRHIRVDFGPHKNFYYLDKYSQLEKEIEIRKNMDEGQVIERELSMLEDFKKEYGYDPTYISVINYNNNDGINTNDSNDELEIDNNSTKLSEIEKEDKINNVSLLNANLRDLKLPDNTFDIVTCFLMFHHLMMLF